LLYKSNVSPPYCLETILTFIFVDTSGYNLTSTSYVPATFIVFTTTFFLSIDKLNSLLIASATSLLVIAPNNLPLSPALAFIVTSLPFNSAANF
jgi:hypothetical protein